MSYALLAIGMSVTTYAGRKFFTGYWPGETRILLAILAALGIALTATSAALIGATP